jgi:hypothetical protein
MTEDRWISLGCWTVALIAIAYVGYLLSVGVVIR